VIGTKIAACNAIMADYADVSKRGLAGNNFLSENL
jgi:hypothetical protein